MGRKQYSQEPAGEDTSTRTDNSCHSSGTHIKKKEKGVLEKAIDETSAWTKRQAMACTKGWTMTPGQSPAVSRSPDHPSTRGHPSAVEG